MRAPALAAALASLLVAASGCSSGDTTTGSSSSSSSSGSGGSGGAPPSRPDPVVNEQKTHAAPVSDVAYPGKVVTQFRTPAELPDLDVRSLAVLGTTVYAGTATGLARFQDGDRAPWP